MITLDNIVSLCKRKGFIYQSSAIYGGLTSAWDYGPLGTLLKRNLQTLWMDNLIKSDDITVFPFDASILMHKDVWKTSGHVDNFTDPLVDCKKCKARFRADQIDLEKPCPNCGNSGTFTQPRNFNLMFQTNIGSIEQEGSIVYLRPETAQGIYVNFKNVVDSFSPKMPFGIAQIGKAFRNEIVTKNFIFRTCEFEQMELQFFVPKEEEDKWYNYFLERRMNYYLNVLGIKKENLKYHDHEKLAHYAKSACDIEYNFPFGFQELEGIHNRGTFDLQSHTDATKKDLSYFDGVKNVRYIPSIIESSSGLTRSLLMVLCEAYHEQEVGDEKRVFMSFHPNIAPYHLAVLPLVKKDGLPEIATELFRDLKRAGFMCQYEETNAIGKRYRKQDEIGTPFCITVDYDTKEDKAVTIRHRDSMEQQRVKIENIETYIKDSIKNYKPTV